MRFIYLLFYGLVLLGACFGDGQYDDGSDQLPKVFVTILVRNKEPVLPYFLTFLMRLDYPKDRLHIWIHSGHNEDGSAQVLRVWRQKHMLEYKNCELMLDFTSEGSKFYNQETHTLWSPQRYQHIINVKEGALKEAKRANATYVFMLDADALLTNPRTLKQLVKKELPVVAPMLLSDGLYSNFWGGMTKDYYYKKSKNYEELVRRKEKGCFSVPMVHSAVLVAIKQESTANLTYEPKKLQTPGAPLDDIISFSLSALENGVEMLVCNEDVYGFIPIPVEDEHSTDPDHVENIKLEVLGRGIDLPVEPDLAKFIEHPKKTKYGLDDIYMINLERRVERKNLMMKSFDILGMDVRLVKAVDGQNISNASLEEHSVRLMPGYEDPYHKRPMKGGEIGCFLSHYGIWVDIAKRSLGAALVMEDDVHFAPFFRERFNTLMQELNYLDWDLVYLGRKALMDTEEEHVTDHISKPLYSYWTLGYLLSERGARKLINAEPLSKMLPVDEFLPIMFNQHPNATWKAMFPARALQAYSAAPLLMQPTHYSGDAGYFSDTENSQLAFNRVLNRRPLNEL